MKNRDVLATFNRGRIGRHAIARTDVSRVALSSDVQTNWMPRALGSMMLRPGLGYIGTVPADGAYVPFIYSTDDSAIIELTAGKARFWIGGDSLLQSVAVTTAITNGGFGSDLAGWTDADVGSAVSAWASGQMRLTGTGYTAARRRQEVTVSGSNVGQVHRLLVHVARGPVLIRIGTSAGADNVFRQAVLRTGYHDLAFTPAGNVHIEFSSSLSYPVMVESVSIRTTAGAVEVTSPYADAATCKLVRWSQSGDVVFLSCEGQKQQRIERRPGNSWSIVEYDTTDGPYLIENVDRITLTPSALIGEITIISSKPYFRSGHVGALFRLESQGQRVEADLDDHNTFTGHIRVTGVENDRRFSVVRAGTWTGSLRLQRSIGEPGSWVTVQTYTTNGTITYDDGLDNSIAYYRIGFGAADYGTGLAEAALEFSSGSISGVVRVTGYTDDDEVSAIVLKDLGGTAATEIWAEGAWSGDAGWPSAVAIWEGRLWWLGKGRVHGSVSDAFSSFDPDYDGDAAPINRSVGDVAVGRINWALPLQRLAVGADGAEYSIRSTSFEEPVTPGNYNAKAFSTRGCGAVPAVNSGTRGYFVGRTENRLFEMQYDAQAYDYTTTDVTLLVPEIGEQGFVRLAVQETPDMRVHALRGDGTVAVLVRDQLEDVLCWVDMETSGHVEDVVVLPGAVEDRVYYRVRREIDGETVRYHERWALESECRGGALSKIADSFVTGTGAVTGLDHLEGETVVIWGDGADRGTAEVAGSAAEDHEYDTWCAGLGYEARYRSAKLAGQTQLGLSLTQRSRINKIGLVLADTHAQGLQYGADFDYLNDLPLVEDGADVGAGQVWSSYDEDMIEFPGDWSPDNRICLVASAPRPCTVLAAILNVDRQDAD